MAEREPMLSSEHSSAMKALVRRPGFVASAVLAVVVVLLGLPVFSTLQPAYYRHYPGLRSRMEHWHTSTHARMSCISCHVKPGIGGFVSFAARSVPAFYSQLLAGPKSTNLLEAPDRTACQKCHTGYREVSPDGDLLIPHRAHVEVLGVNCVVCHKNLVHSSNAEGFNRPEMSTCLSLCHDGRKATDKCVKCHTRKQTPPSHEQSDWLAIHGRMSQTIDCGKCHDWTPDYCGDCHRKRPPTHTGNWKTQHAVRARVSSKGCMVCHSVGKFCEKCH